MENMKLINVLAISAVVGLVVVAIAVTWFLPDTPATQAECVEQNRIVHITTDTDQTVDGTYMVSRTMWYCE